MLRAKLAEINLREVDDPHSVEHVPWLNEGRVSEAVAAITRIARLKLIEANQAPLIASPLGGSYNTSLVIVHW
ncbi:MAG: hypothetical protein V4739_19520 [Pseudomonadota bacterium]